MQENNNHRNEIYSKKVLAGKRTYFFDVKATRDNEYYLTITESKRRNGDDGAPFYEKHKIFLYRDDFAKFADSLVETLNHIDSLSGDAPLHKTPQHEEEPARHSEPEPKKESPSAPKSSFTDVSFDDLG